MRRRLATSPLSLFAFQDIITATTGILILLTLWMTMFIRAGAALKTEQLTAATAETLSVDTTPLEVLEAALAKREQELRDLQERSQRLAGLSAAELRTRLEALESANREMEQRLAAQGNPRGPDPEGDQSRSRLETVRQELARLEEQEQAVKAAIEQERKSDRVYYSFRDDADSVPWLLEVSGTALTVARSGAKVPPRVFDQPRSGARLAAFRKWLESLPPDDRYFVVLVRPSGVGIFGALESGNAVRPILEQAGAGIGIDLLTETQTAIDPATGASR